MSSLDMVAFINATREAGKAELQHKEFLRKVPSVLGYETSAQFYAHVNLVVGNGATRQSPIYNFPRREAMLMAMSYSCKLQATVYPFRVVRRMAGIEFSGAPKFQAITPCRAWAEILAHAPPGEHEPKFRLMLRL